MSVYILIPSFNPDDKLLNLIEELNKNQFNIVLVNDGSSDHESKYIFQTISERFPNVLFLKHFINKGKGEAIKTGIKYINETYFDHPSVLTIDGDGQHTVSDILNIVSKMESHPKQFYLGVRNFSKKTPWKSAVGNRFTTFILKLIFKVSISDSQSGLRGIPNCLLLKMLTINGSRFEYETSVIIYLIKNRININCIPIQTVYFDKNIRTNFRAFSDSVSILKVIINNIF